MSKLFKLRHVFTLDEAAKYLSVSFGEEVGVKDVLRLGLDGHLTLSVHFVNKAHLRFGNVIPITEAKSVRIPRPSSVEGGEETVLVISGINLGNDEILELEETVRSVDGVWDLPMLGAEVLDIEHEYQQMTGGPAVTLINLEGAFVKDPFASEKSICQIQNSFSNGFFFPHGGLPEDSVIVVRKGALTELEKKFSDPVDKELSTKTENTYLKIIGAQAEVLLSGLSGFKYKDAAALMAIFDRAGVNPPASEKTLAKCLGLGNELRE